MVSQYKNNYFGLSTDSKPTGTALNGRGFEEMDTGKKYRFDAENQQWLQQDGGGGGSSTLAGLTDVDISNPTDGQVLVYDATAGKWVNGSGGGGLQYATVTFYNVNEDDETPYLLDSTQGVIVNGIMNGAAEVTPTNNAIVKVPLGENGCFLTGYLLDGIDPSFDPVMTGDVSFDLSFFGFIITGDCTISLKSSGTD